MINNHKNDKYLKKKSVVNSTSIKGLHPNSFLKPAVEIFIDTEMKLIDKKCLIAAKHQLCLCLKKVCPTKQLHIVGTILPNKTLLHRTVLSNMKPGSFEIKFCECS